MTSERRTAPSIVACQFIFGCATAGRAVPDCTPLNPPREGWVQHRGAHLSFELPGAFVRTEARGIDSEVAEYVAPTASVSHDYGAYSNSLVELRDMKIEWSCLITMHETPVRFVTGRREAQFVVAAHWPNLDDSAVGRVSLTVYGVAQDAIAARTLRGVLRSVRVDTVARLAPPP